MSIKTGYSDVIWGYAGTFLRFGASLIILPLVLKTLPSDELGIWYIFQTLNALVALLDFGFSGTLIRNISYSWAGVKNLNKTGLSGKKNKQPNLFLLWNIIKEARKIYFFISLGALILSGVFGSYYIYTISHGKLSLLYIFSTWAIFLTGLYLNLYYGYWNIILTGLGMVKQYQKANVVSGALYVIVSLAGLFLGMGISALAISFLLSGFVIRILSKRFFFSFMKSKGYPHDGYRTVKPYPGLFGILWHNTRKTGITTLGSYLIFQFNLFYIPIFISLSAAASYGLAMQIMRLIMQFGNVPLISNYAQINCLRAENRKNELAVKISPLYAFGFTLVVCGALIDIFLGDWFLTILHSKTLLPEGPIVLLMMIMMVLEWSNGFFTLIITSENRIPFMKSTIFSGLAIAVSTYFLLKFSTIGLLAVVVPQISIQMMYNYWRWHKWVFADLSINYVYVLKTGSTGLVENARRLTRKVFSKV